MFDYKSPNFKLIRTPSDNKALFMIEGLSYKKMTTIVRNGLILSLLLVFLAIVFYSGDFNLTEEYLGNLNTLRSVTNGKPNLWPRIFFYTATIIMIILGFLFFEIFKNFQIRTSENETVYLLSKINQITGSISLIIYFFITLYPNDQLLFANFPALENEILPKLGLLLITITLIGITINQIIHESYSIYLTIPGILLSILSIFLFIAILFLNDNPIFL